jgi:hypothetical protein
MDNLRVTQEQDAGLTIEDEEYQLECNKAEESDKQGGYGGEFVNCADTFIK